MSKIGQTEQWWSVHGWQETGSNRERYPALSVKDGRKQASNLHLFKECRTASSG